MRVNGDKPLKSKPILVLTTEQEKEDFKLACKFFRKKQSTYLRRFVIELIRRYKEEQQ